MKYNFSEKNLGSDFCHDTVEAIRLAIQKGTSSTLLGMPMSGMITLFRYLTTKDFAYFIYLDAQTLKHKTRNEFFTRLYHELNGTNSEELLISPFEGCRKRIKELLLSQNKIVVLIPRLDSLTEELKNGLFGDFKTLADFGIKRILFFGTSRLPFNRLNCLVPQDNPSFMTNPIYFLPLNKNDCKRLVNFLPGGKNTSKQALEQIFQLSGGHISLLWQLLKTDHFDNPIQDEILQIHLKTIYDAYLPLQKSQLRSIASGKPIKEVDPFLLKIGLVKESDGKHELFTPLLRDYINKYVQTKLPKKERVLFALLKKKLNKLVTKDEIIETVWGEMSDGISDWSINSLIYRLRKSQTFRSSGFVIENDKSEGYRLIKE